MDSMMDRLDDGVLVFGTVSFAVHSAASRSPLAKLVAHALHHV